jgi:hypothetical protein
MMNISIDFSIYLMAGAALLGGLVTCFRYRGRHPVRLFGFPLSI